MNTKRFFIVMLVLVGALMVGLNVVSAQDNPGNGNGSTYGNGVASPCGTCLYQSECNFYQSGRNSDMSRGNRNTDMPRGNWNTDMSRGNWNSDMPRGNGGYYGDGMFYRLPPASTDALPQDVVDLMISGWLDEQNAYATYDAIINQFGTVRPFVNVQSAEAQHIASWELLFDRYGIEPGAVPTFDLPEFASLTDACAASAAAEVANFDLYDTMLTAFEPYPDLVYVAQTLRDASEYSHLIAFENCAS